MFASTIMREMSSWELTYWFAYDQIHPIEEASWCSGLVVSEMWKAQNSKNQHSVPEDFLPLGATIRAKIINEKSQARLKQMQGQATVDKLNAQFNLIRQGLLKPEDLKLG